MLRLFGPTLAVYDATMCRPQFAVANNSIGWRDAHFESFVNNLLVVNEAESPIITRPAESKWRSLQQVCIDGERVRVRSRC